MHKKNVIYRYLAIVPKEHQSVTAARVGVHASTVSRWSTALRKGRKPGVRFETRLALEIAIERLDGDSETEFTRGVRYALGRLHDAMGALELEAEVGGGYGLRRAAATGSPRALTPTEIKAARKRLGLTQRKFAEALGNDVRTVGRWELGREAPPPYLALALESLGA